MPGFLFRTASAKLRVVRHRRILYSFLQLLMMQRQALVDRNLTPALKVKAGVLLVTGTAGAEHERGKAPNHDANQTTRPKK
jgi:hypothetical protein